jgi:hypothetical protein
MYAAASVCHFALDVISRLYRTSGSLSTSEINLFLYVDFWLQNCVRIWSLYERNMLIYDYKFL